MISLMAGTGDDYLIGGSGNDRLISGGGSDQMKSGAGDDVLVLNTGNHGDHIIVHDFNTAEDRLEIESTLTNSNNEFLLSATGTAADTTFSLNNGVKLTILGLAIAEASELEISVF